MACCKKGMRVKLMSTGAVHPIDRVGIFRPKQEMLDVLGPGEVGFFTAAIKEVADTRVGDTVTEDKRPADASAAGLQACPAGGVLRSLSRSTPRNSKTYATPWRSCASTMRASNMRWKSSAALGFGFRCGFLGLLHLEIIRERLEREFNIDLITTAPSVIYHLHMNDGEMREMHNPADMPDVVKIDRMEEPWIKATIFVPDEYLGAVLKLCEDRRGRQKELTYAGSRAMVVYELPLNEVVFDFYDRLKSISRGYASFDYRHHGL